MKCIKILIMFMGIIIVQNSSAQKTKSIKIIIKMENIPENTNVYLTNYKVGRFGDTLCRGISQNGKLSFKTELLLDGGDFFFLRNGGKRSILFLDEYVSNTLTITGDYNDWRRLKINGSEACNNYILIAEELALLRNKVQNIKKSIAEENKMDSLNKAIYLRELESAQESYYKVWYDKIFHYPDLAFSAALIKDGGFLNIEKKKKAFKILSSRVKNGKYGRAVFQQILELEKQNDPRTPQEKALSVGMGKKVPDFSFKTPEGNFLSFKEALNGSKLLFIDFWASWCKPCRAENPNVRKVYNTYHKRGFNILGISLDNDEISWKKAINKDQLNWSNVSDLKGWGSDAAIIFNITSIPKSILVDEEGKIIVMDLRGEELEKKVEEILGRSK